MPADAILTYADYANDPRPMLQNSDLDYTTWLQKQYRMLQGRAAPLQPMTPTLPAAVAFVDGGRWIWQCGDCGAGVPASQAGVLTICPACGDDWMSQKFPANQDEIETELLKQPGFRGNAPVRLWHTGMTVADLRERTAKADALKKQGVSRVRALSIGQTRTWSVGEILTAGNKNTFEKDVLRDLAGRNGRIDLENTVRVKTGTSHSLQPYTEIAQDYIRPPVRANDPGTGSGRLIYRSDINQLRYYAGTSWQNIPQNPVPIAEGGTGSTTAAAAAVALNIEPMAIGLVAYWSADADTPARWLPCDGRAVSRTTYPELYALIGDTYHVPHAVYAGNISGGRIYRVDISARTAVALPLPPQSDPGLQNILCMAAIHDGPMYAVDEIGDELWHINLFDPSQSELVGDLPSGMNNVQGLAALDGVMYAGNRGGSFWRVNLFDPSQSERIGDLPDGLSNISGMVTHAGEIYAANRNADTIYRIDVDDPVQSDFLGSLPSGIEFASPQGLTAFNGEVYLISFPNFLSRINLSNISASTYLGRVSGIPTGAGVYSFAAGGTPDTHFTLPHLPRIGSTRALIRA